MDIKAYFEGLNLSHWKIEDPNNERIDSGGQAQVIFVENLKGQKGAFRKLNNPRPIDIERFKREISVLTEEAYRHPNLINILEFSIDDDKYWYISAKGSSFEEYWNKIKSSKTTPTEVLKEGLLIIKKLASALVKLHENNIVHRDIKEANIVVIDDEPTLIDFGLVYKESDERITPPNKGLGNKEFSPTPAMDRMDEVTPWLDIFCLSQLMIWMLAELPPKYFSWRRPLDWRYVKFNTDLAESDTLSLKAIIAVCSEISLAPKNATELIQLIDKLFFQNIIGGSQSLNVNISDIKRKGEAQALLNQAEESISLEASFALAEVIYTKISHQIDLCLNQCHIENIKFTIKEQHTLREMYQDMASNGAFGGCLYKVTFGIDGFNQFDFNFHCTVMTNTFLKRSSNYSLFEDQNMFTSHMEFYTNSPTFPQKVNFISVFNNGDIAIRSEQRMNNKLIQIEDIFTILSNWIKDEKVWEYVYTEI